MIKTLEGRGISFAVKRIHTEINGLLFCHKVNKHSEAIVTFKYIYTTKFNINQIGKKTIFIALLSTLSYIIPCIKFTKLDYIHLTFDFHFYFVF